MIIFSVNIRTYSEEKFKFIKANYNPDIIFFQETRIKNVNAINDFSVFYSYTPYGGILTAIKNEIMKDIKEIKNLIDGRLMLIEFKNGLCVFNVYHKRISSDRKSIDQRIQYDILFLETIEKYKNRKCIFSGDFNSVHKLHDSVKNLKIKDDGRVCPEDWNPIKPLDKNFGCYERHFMVYFLNNWKLIDNGINKGFTFKKNNNDCMRIDYVLSSELIDEYAIQDLGDLTDHKAIVFKI